MTKTGLVRLRRFGHCDLSGICDVLFGILSHFIAPIAQLTEEAMGLRYLSVPKLMVGSLVFQNLAN